MIDLWRRTATGDKWIVCSLVVLVLFFAALSLWG